MYIYYSKKNRIYIYIKKKLVETIAIEPKKEQRSSSKWFPHVMFDQNTWHDVAIKASAFTLANIKELPSSVTKRGWQSPVSMGIYIYRTYTIWLFNRVMEKPNF